MSGNHYKGGYDERLYLRVPSNLKEQVQEHVEPLTKYTLTDFVLDAIKEKLTREKFRTKRT